MPSNDARARIPPSGGGSRSTDWHAKTMWFLKPFPCSQRECVAEKERNRVDRKRNRHRVVRDAELPVRKRSPRVGERKANQRRSVVTAERIRLLSPIHVAKRCCVAMVVVLRSLVVGSHDLLVKKVAVRVRLQREIRRSISLHVPRCLPVTCVQMPRIGEGRHRTPGRAVRRARRPRRFTVPAQTVRPKDLITTNIGNYPASVFLERLRLQLAGARLR